jgi:hypothetical protein
VPTLATDAPAPPEEPELHVLPEARLGQVRTAARERIDDLREGHALGVLALDRVELRLVEESPFVGSLS